MWINRKWKAKAKERLKTTGIAVYVHTQSRGTVHWPGSTNKARHKPVNVLERSGVFLPTVETLKVSRFGLCQQDHIMHTPSTHSYKSRTSHISHTYQSHNCLTSRQRGVNACATALEATSRHPLSVSSITLLNSPRALHRSG
jgi:hypothetical protein